MTNKTKEIEVQAEIFKAVINTTTFPIVLKGALLANPMRMIWLLTPGFGSMLIEEMPEYQLEQRFDGMTKTMLEHIAVMRANDDTVDMRQTLELIKRLDHPTDFDTLEDMAAAIYKEMYQIAAINNPDPDGLRVTVELIDYFAANAKFN